MAALQDKARGCVLPESQRRYYLELMGIQAWESLQADTGALEQAVVEQSMSAAQDTASLAEGDSQWQDLRLRVSNCTLCELHKTRTQTVFGTGNPQADLLVIGEAPGRDEDLQGEPFVGRAGVLLNAMLLAIGFEREQVYIANILKCRPPNNRDPQPQEIDNCQAYLRQQIELIRPRAIFAVGRVATQALLNSTATMGAMRGKQHSYQGIPLIASYHPAYLLRKPTEKRKSWQDLLLLKRLLDSCQ